MERSLPLNGTNERMFMARDVPYAGSTQSVGDARGNRDDIQSQQGFAP